jgi:hypothetical protein
MDLVKHHRGDVVEKQVHVLVQVEVVLLQGCQDVNRVIG